MFPLLGFVPLYFLCVGVGVGVGVGLTVSLEDLCDIKS